MTESVNFDDVDATNCGEIIAGSPTTTEGHATAEEHATVASSNKKIAIIAGCVSVLGFVACIALYFFVIRPYLKRKIENRRQNNNFEQHRREIAEMKSNSPSPEPTKTKNTTHSPLEGFL